MLEVGAAVPDVAADDDTGTRTSLRAFAGKRIVLWFYPKADTPG
jgi:peroxiredoxin Q/BCP